ncbi:MAG TPA: hypothetical protein DCY79_25520 [Planctomycetaceae bacterium]|nr:hypothetical protein [Blastopirellula sp.]HAY83180.1 hypothetical protein [Planctomycetaceae bacterium]
MNFASVGASYSQRDVDNRSSFSRFEGPIGFPQANRAFVLRLAQQLSVRTRATLPTVLVE